MSNRKVMIGFKADAEVKEKLEKIADIEDRSISYIVNRFVVQGIENYTEWKEQEGNRALEVLRYIQEAEFSSYSDFIKLAIKQNALDWVNENLGELQAYMIVCEKLGIQADQRTIETIEHQELIKSLED